MRAAAPDKKKQTKTGNPARNLIRSSREDQSPHPLILHLAPRHNHRVEQSTVKQTLVVRKDLKMRKGKIGAQCAHAAMKVLMDRMPPVLQGNEIHRTLVYPSDSAWARWLEGRFTKVCVYVDSEEALDEVYHRAKQAGLPAALIIDSGRTEFGGQPTKTVVAVGPADREDVDRITGDLPLY